MSRVALLASRGGIRMTRAAIERERRASRAGAWVRMNTQTVQVLRIRVRDCWWILPVPTPCALAEQVQVSQDIRGVIPQWPIIQPFDWCGSWRERGQQ